jgi:hypothetical protein
MEMQPNSQTTSKLNHDSPLNNFYGDASLPLTGGLSNIQNTKVENSGTAPVFLLEASLYCSTLFTIQIPSCDESAYIPMSCLPYT